MKPSARLRTAVLVLAMAIFTVPAPGAERVRENTEWDIAYWYNANDDKLPRVLLIGDSICRGYEAEVRDQLAGVATVSYWTTSKCATDRSFLKQLGYILEEYPYAVVHFNTGLHSLNTDLAQWEAALRAALNLIRTKAPAAKIVWASSTPLRDSRRGEKVQALNDTGNRLARDAGLPIDDLFALTDPLDRNTYWTDTYHFTAEARKLQGGQVTACIRKMLGGKNATPADAQAALKGAASATGADGPFVPTQRRP